MTSLLVKINSNQERELTQLTTELATLEKKHSVEIGQLQRQLTGILQVLKRKGPSITCSLRDFRKMRTFDA